MKPFDWDECTCCGGTLTDDDTCGDCGCTPEPAPDPNNCPWPRRTR